MDILKGKIIKNQSPWKEKREIMSEEKTVEETTETAEAPEASEPVEVETVEEPKVSNKVTVDQILELAEERGAVLKEQKAFHKLTSASKNKKALYVSRTKNGLTRLDIAGFVPAEHEAIVSLSAEEAKDQKLGAVRGQILPKELRCSADSILEAVTQCLDGLLSEVEGFKLSRKPVEVVEAIAVAADEGCGYPPSALTGRLDRIRERAESGAWNG